MEPEGHLGEEGKEKQEEGREGRGREGREEGREGRGREGREEEDEAGGGANNTMRVPLKFYLHIRRTEF